jgi:hypothetical protein
MSKSATIPKKENFMDMCERLVAMKRNGMTIPQIAEQLGEGQQNIRNYLTIIKSSTEKDRSILRKYINDWRAAKKRGLLQFVGNLILRRDAHSIIPLECRLLLKLNLSEKKYKDFFTLVALNVANMDGVDLPFPDDDSDLQDTLAEIEDIASY